MKINERADVDTFAELADFVAAGDLFVLTGAGLSTESGIPDYRNSDGTRRSIPMTFQEFCATDAARRRYWVRSSVGWERFSAARHNPGHAVVASLQRAGLVTSLVTQNVDGLHQEAGAQDVRELHGNLDGVVCVNCGEREPRAAFQARLRRANPTRPTDVELLADGDAAVAPHLEDAFTLVPCLRCGSTIVKPDVVMFGQSVEPGMVDQCFAAVERASRVLVLGSSLRVMSGYGFVLAALKQGKPVALVGLGEMRGQERADLVVRGPLGDVLTQLEEELVRRGVVQR